MIDIARRPGRFYSPLRYPGGKASLTDFLSDVIRTNDIKDCTLIEPFAGGAGASISLLLLERVDHIVVNDIDRAIFSFWNAIVNDTDKFIDRIGRTKLTMKEWNQYRTVYKNENADSFELGFATFFMNRTNRSGIIEGGPIGGVAQEGNWGINARFNKDGLIERIERIAAYKNRITVSNVDGIKLFNRHSRLKRAKSNVLFFIDPPYFVKGSSLYLNYYTFKHHEKLAACLNGKPDMNWVLTYDNTEEIREFYRCRRNYPFELNYHADKAKVGNELLVFSDGLELPLRYSVNVK